MMKPIEPPIKYWTKGSIETLAIKFSLENNNYMQDWAWQVASPKKVEEFVAALKIYTKEPDVLFTLMDVILGSIEDSEIDLKNSHLWRSVKSHLKANYTLHAYQIWYWSSFDLDLNDAWRISPFLRKIWAEQNMSER